VINIPSFPARTSEDSRQTSVSAASVRPRGNPGGSRRPSPFPAWVLLTGILLIPASLQVRLAGEGLKITPGRAAILLLLLPAIGKLWQKGRHFVSSDLFMFLACAWMIGSRLPQDGLNPSAVIEAVELGGGYIVARGYFFGRPELKEFMRVFKIITVIVILIAILDPLFGRNVITELFVPGAWRQYRGGIVRAQSTIEDGEHFGTFCCVAGSLLLYAEPTRGRKILWGGFCFFGCILSISAGPILAYIIVLATFLYDESLKYSWRWKAYQMTIALAVGVVYYFSASPTHWIVAHLTLDPQNSYFRLYVFDYYDALIALRPLTGWGFLDQYGDDEFLGVTTVDNVWIVLAIRFGLPMIVFLLMANIGTFFRAIPRTKGSATNPYIDSLGTGVTISLVCFWLVGLTVHYWNAIWMLWGVCLGLRAAIKEAQIWTPNHQPPAAPVRRNARLYAPAAGHGGWRR
jgi:hypothetical protein